MRYEVRELGVGGILDQAVTLTKNHFGVLLGIAAVLQVPFGLLQEFVVEGMSPALPANPTPEDALAFQNASLANLAYTLPLILLNAYIVAPITNAAMVYAISNAYLDRPVGVGDSFKKAFGMLGSLIVTWLLVGLAIMGGFLLCVIPGILAAFWFALATQVVVIEGISGVAAMKRSKELMKGNIGTMFVLGLLVGVATMLLTGGAALVPNTYVQSVITVLVQTALTIFATAAFVVFYFSCRCRHEQFDLALLAQSVGVESPAVETGGNTGGDFPELNQR